MKRRRFRFSLLSFFVIVTLIGVSMGVWLGMIGPIRSQWRSAEIILESGASLETSPSSIPRWMKSLLPEGQCDNIVAVDFKRQNATDAAIKALEASICSAPIFSPPTSIRLLGCLKSRHCPFGAIQRFENQTFANWPKSTALN